MEHADGRREADISGVHCVLRKFVRRFVLLRFFRHFWLREVCQTVCEVSADSSQVGCGQSVIRGVVPVVQVAFLNGPPYACRRSALPPQTLRPLHVDGLPRAVKIA
jgi:hypothetical protein